MAQAFLQWTQSLAGSETFKQFINYVLATGPQLLMFFKVLMTTVFDLITVLAPLGNVMIGVLNIALSFINVLFNLMFGVGSLKNRVETLKNSFLDLGNAIAVMLGYKTVDTTSQQTDEVSNLNQAYQDMVGSIGDVGGGLKDAGKDAQKFLASFDEMYQIPDKLDSAMGSLPKPPTPPIGGGIGGGGTSGGGVSGWNDPSGNGLFDKLAENFSKIPKTITTPVFEPTLEETETKAKTALGGIIAKIGEVSPAFSIMLSTMNGSLKTNIPSIIQNIGLITASMAFPTLTTSLSFSTMLADMLSNSKTYIPSIKTWLQDITDKLTNMRTEMNPTSTAFDVMLAAFMTSVNTNVPLVVTALMLITDWIKNIGTESPKTQTAFHEMLDFMQSKANAYQPYISTQLSFIKEALEDVKQSSSETRVNWRTVFEDMAKVTHSNSLSIITDIGKIISKQKELNEVMGQTITTPTRERTPAVEEPTLQWAPPTTTYNPPDVTPTVEPTVPEDQTSPTQVEQNGKVDSWFRKFIDAIINAPKINTGGINITPSIGGGVDFKKFLENLPGHANGAVIGNETIARIGEGNKREAIIPLKAAQ
jgi:hypothetical protein